MSLSSLAKGVSSDLKLSGAQLLASYVDVVVTSAQSQGNIVTTNPWFYSFSFLLAIFLNEVLLSIFDTGSENNALP